MSDKYQNRYRMPSTRLQNWDYGSNAAYFVTICTKNKESFFGEIVDKKMFLSEIGEIVETEWLKTPKIRPDMNLELGDFMVMPNHFHAIIYIGENKYNTERGMERGTERRDAMHGVSTTNATTNATNEYKNTFAPQSKNLGSIMRGFKSSVTTIARKIHPDFAWQPRFHDHIIRDSESFQRISEYIRNNPLNWRDDTFHNKPL